jgi:beta-glucanase (GH16 family)
MTDFTLPAGWPTVTFFDDFNGSLNRTVWEVADKVGYTRDQAWLTKEQVTVKDSCLIITASKMPAPIKGRTVTSGAVDTRGLPGFRQRGGRFEICAALPTAAALWSAGWGRNDPAHGELDIFETVGPNSPIVQTAHQDTSGTADHLGYAWTAPTGWQRSQLHVYAIEWDADKGAVRWYIDGQLTRTVTPATIGQPSNTAATWLTGAAYASPMALLLNLQVGGKFCTYYGNQIVNPAQLDGTAQAQLRVDWVRVLSR